MLYLGPALRCVATVAATAAVGAYARRRGVLCRFGVRVLERAVAEIFTPALIVLKVLPNVSGATLRAAWPMALMCLVIVSWGFGSGWCACRLLRRRHPAVAELSGLVMTALAFPNSFSVPYSVFLALGAHPALQQPGAPPAPHAAVEARASSLFLFSYVVWVAARWSIGYPALTGACQSPRAWAGKVGNPPTVALALALPLGALASALSLDAWAASDGREWLAPAVQAVEYAARCLVPSTLFTLGAQLSAAVQSVRGTARAAGRRRASGARASGGALGGEAECGAVASVAPGRATKELCDASASPSEAASHLSEAASHLESHLGAAAEAGRSDQAGRAGAEVGGEGAEGGTDEGPVLPAVAYAAIILGRQVAGPLIGASVARALRDVLGVTDRVTLLVAMLQSAGPPMSNLAVMAGLAGGEAVSRASALVLLATYSFSLISWTAAISLFLSVLEEG